jgi:hypothetical protein
VPSPPFERAVDRIGHITEQARSQQLSSRQFSEQVVDVMLEYLQHEDPRDDPTLLARYCIECARDVSGLGLLADRMLPGEVERRLEWCLEHPVQRLDFNRMLDRLRSSLSDHDGDASIELVDLCRRGVDLHPRFFSRSGWGAEVVRLAHEFGVITAIEAALTPSSGERLASPERDDGVTYRLALDLLAQTAADIDVSARRSTAACDALVRLTGHLIIAGDAAVRLPVHRLSDNQVDDLHESFERRCDVQLELAAVGHLLERGTRADTEIIRGVLWLVADLRNTRSAPQHASSA